MPLYRFNVLDGTSPADEVGTELPDPEAARVECVRFAGQVIADAAHRDSSRRTWAFEVADEVGRPLFRMEFKVADLRQAV